MAGVRIRTGMCGNETGRQRTQIWRVRPRRTASAPAWLGFGAAEKALLGESDCGPDQQYTPFGVSGLDPIDADAAIVLFKKVM